MGTDASVQRLDQRFVSNMNSKHELATLKIVQTENKTHTMGAAPRRTIADMNAVLQTPKLERGDKGNPALLIWECWSEASIAAPKGERTQHHGPGWCLHSIENQGQHNTVDDATKSIVVGQNARARTSRQLTPANFQDQWQGDDGKAVLGTHRIVPAGERHNYELTLNKPTLHKKVKPWCLATTTAWDTRNMEPEDVTLEPPAHECPQQHMDEQMHDLCDCASQHTWEQWKAEMQSLGVCLTPQSERCIQQNAQRKNQARSVRHTKPRNAHQSEKYTVRHVQPHEYNMATHHVAQQWDRAKAQQQSQPHERPTTAVSGVCGCLLHGSRSCRRHGKKHPREDDSQCAEMWSQAADEHVEPDEEVETATAKNDGVVCATCRELFVSKTHFAAHAVVTGHVADLHDVAITTTAGSTTDDQTGIVLTAHMQQDTTHGNNNTSSTHPEASGCKVQTRLTKAVATQGTCVKAKGKLDNESVVKSVNGPADRTHRQESKQSVPQLMRTTREEQQASPSVQFELGHIHASHDQKAAIRLTKEQLTNHNSDRTANVVAIQAKKKGVRCMKHRGVGVPSADVAQSHHVEISGEPVLGKVAHTVKKAASHVSVLRRHVSALLQAATTMATTAPHAHHTAGQLLRGDVDVAKTCAARDALSHASWEEVQRQQMGNQTCTVQNIAKSGVHESAEGLRTLCKRLQIIGSPCVLCDVQPCPGQTPQTAFHTRHECDVTKPNRHSTLLSMAERHARSGIMGHSDPGGTVGCHGGRKASIHDSGPANKDGEITTKSPMQTAMLMLAQHARDAGRSRTKENDEGKSAMVKLVDRKGSAHNVPVRRAAFVVSM